MTRKADRYEQRARELAIAAGLDPDGRVIKPGSDRGMPAWCSFRDAARAEQVAAEAERAKIAVADIARIS